MCSILNYKSSQCSRGVIGLLIVSVFVEVALPQGELPLAVSVNVIVPAVISAALGVYVQVVNEFALAKIPVPLDVHVIEV